MDKKTAITDANNAGKAINVGKRVAAAIQQEVPVACAAVKTKAMKINQVIIRPKTEPAARAILEKGVRPALDKAVKAKDAAAQWLESPDRKYIQDYKKDKLKVHFKEAARQPLTLRKTVAEPKGPGPQKGIAIGDKRTQAQQLIARPAAAKTPSPAPKKGPPKTK